MSVSSYVIICVVVVSFPSLLSLLAGRCSYLMVHPPANHRKAWWWCNVASPMREHCAYKSAPVWEAGDYTW